jgi:hypothetical protein
VELGTVTAFIYKISDMQCFIDMQCELRTVIMQTSEHA